MTTFSPMMACGPSFGPEILLIFVPWLIGIVAALINTVIICSRMGNQSAGFGHPLIFLGYVGLAAAFIRGAFGTLASDTAMVLFFGIPVLPVAHTAYLVYAWRKDRRSNREREEI